MTDILISNNNTRKSVPSIKSDVDVLDFTWIRAGYGNNMTVSLQIWTSLTEVFLFGQISAKHVLLYYWRLNHKMSQMGKSNKNDGERQINHNLLNL